MYNSRALKSEKNSSPTQFTFVTLMGRNDSHSLDLDQKPSITPPCENLFLRWEIKQMNLSKICFLGGKMKEMKHYLSVMSHVWTNWTVKALWKPKSLLTSPTAYTLVIRSLRLQLTYLLLGDFVVFFFSLKTTLEIKSYI